MMKRLRYLAVLYASVQFATIAFAEPVTVLGLPLGGKPQPSVGQCKGLPGRKYTEQGLCWVYSRSDGKGGASGMLNVPNPDGRPKWAAYAEFKANVDKSGILTDFTVVARDASLADEIIDSIATRFGKPTASNSQPPTKWYAAWDKTEVAISVLCNVADGCYVRFASAAVAAADRERIKARMKVDAARPISP